jgi:hypothetical protein
VRTRAWQLAHAGVAMDATKYKTLDISEVTAYG